MRASLKHLVVSGLLLATFLAAPLPPSSDAAEPPAASKVVPVLFRDLFDVQGKPSKIASDQGARGRTLLSG